MYPKIYSTIKEVWGNSSRHELFFKKLVSLSDEILNNPIQAGTLLNLCENDISIPLWFSSPACPVLDLRFIYNDACDIELTNKQVSDAIKSGFLKMNNCQYEDWQSKTYMIFIFQPFAFGLCDE